jgi:hypothetical protein
VRSNGRSNGRLRGRRAPGLAPCRPEPAQRGSGSDEEAARKEQDPPDSFFPTAPFGCLLGERIQ